VRRSYFTYLPRVETRATSVLRVIEAAVDKRLSSDQDPPVRKRDRLFALICRRAKDVRRMYKDPDELEELGQKFQNVMDKFKVSRTPGLYIPTLLICPCMFRSPLCSVPSSVT
jgi:hypothetical protein